MLKRKSFLVISSKCYFFFFFFFFFLVGLHNGIGESAGRRSREAKGILRQTQAATTAFGASPYSIIRKIGIQADFLRIFRRKGHIFTLLKSRTTSSEIVAQSTKTKRI